MDEFDATLAQLSLNRPRLVTGTSFFGRNVGESRNAIIVVRNSETLVGVTIARGHNRARTRGFGGHCGW
jgi:hypothetical protein